MSRNGVVKSEQQLEQRLFRKLLKAVEGAPGDIKLGGQSIKQPTAAQKKELKRMVAQKWAAKYSS